MDQLLTNSKPLLPGFRFHPTDEELFVYYLKRKCMGKSLSPQMMSEVDVYQFPPWDLPEKSWMKTRDLSWYFFCPRSKKYARGARTNRSTEQGYWKSTGNDRTVNYKNRPVGKIKTLIFHLGKAPKGDRTDWVMHEYRLEDKSLADKGVFQDLYAICKVYKKSGQGPKNGENYGAPFVEEDWETDDDDESLQTGVGIPLANEGETQSVSAVTNTLPNHDSATARITPMNDGSFLLDTPPITPMMNDGSFLLDTPPITPMNDGSCSFLQDIDPMKIIEGDELEKMLAMFTEEDIDTPIVRNEKNAEEHNDTPPVVGTKNVMVDNDVYHGLGDLAQTDQMGFSWSQLAGEIGKDYCIHLDDLAEILNR